MEDDHAQRVQSVEQREGRGSMRGEVRLNVGWRESKGLWRAVVELDQRIFQLVESGAGVPGSELFGSIQVSMLLLECFAAQTYLLPPAHDHFAILPHISTILTNRLKSASVGPYSQGGISAASSSSFSPSPTTPSMLLE